MNYRQPFSEKSFHFNTNKGSIINVEKKLILKAVEETHLTIDKFTEFDVDVFRILGMRNLSAFVGEIFAAMVAKYSNKLFKSNPHQDGYPDLLAMDDVGVDIWNKLKGKHRYRYT